MLRLRDFQYKISLLVSIFICLFIFADASNSQDLPDKIRGYKVYKADIKVQNESESDAKEKDLRVEVDFEEPEVASVGLFGVTVELGSKVTVFGQSGTIDFISFKDFEVNGIKVNIEEYKESFEFKKGEPVELKKPVEIFVSTTQTLRGALKEYQDSKDEWLVKGRIFVFGKFNKLGFKFKRVIPVDVELMIKNPLKENSET